MRKLSFLCIYCLVDELLDQAQQLNYDLLLQRKWGKVGQIWALEHLHPSLFVHAWLCTADCIRRSCWWSSLQEEMGDCLHHILQLLFCSCCQSACALFLFLALFPVEVVCKSMALNSERTIQMRVRHLMKFGPPGTHSDNSLDAEKCVTVRRWVS